MKKTALLLAVLAMGYSAQAQEVETAPSYSVTLDFPYVTKYVFRGVELANDSIQPSVEFASGDFYAGIWSSLPLEAADDLTKEFDFYAGYGIALNDTWKLDVGATVYYYPEVNGFTSTEAFAGVNGEIVSLTTSLYTYYDFQLDAFTVQGSVGYSIPLSFIGSSLDLSATAGSVTYDDTPADYYYYGAGASVPYKLAENATLTLGVQWAGNDSTAAGVSDNVLWGTAGVSIGF